MESPKTLRVMVRRSGLRKALGDISRTSMWRLEKTDPDFPKPVQIGPNLEAFFADEVAAYQDKLAVHRRKALGRRLEG